MRPKVSKVKIIRAGRLGIRTGRHRLLARVILEVSAGLTAASWIFCSAGSVFANSSLITLSSESVWLDAGLLASNLRQMVSPLVDTGVNQDSGPVAANVAVAWILRRGSLVPDFAASQT